jgi:hypothetical protein
MVKYPWMRLSKEHTLTVGIDEPTGLKDSLFFIDMPKDDVTRVLDEVKAEGAELYSDQLPILFAVVFDSVEQVERVEKALARIKDSLQGAAEND